MAPTFRNICISAIFLYLIYSRGVSVYNQENFIYFQRNYDEMREFYRKLKSKVLVKEVEYKMYNYNQKANLILHPQSSISQINNIFICFGGNAMLGLDWIDIFYPYYLAHDKTNTAFYLIDYPGYGYNKGTPSPEDILLNSINAITALFSTYFFSNFRMGLISHSLGGSASLMIAKYYADLPLGHPHKLFISTIIFVSPFTSLADVAAIHYPIPFVKNFVRHKYDNIEAIQSLITTYLENSLQLSLNFFHGHNDDIVPPFMSKVLAVKALDIIKTRDKQCRLIQVNFNVISRVYNDNDINHSKILDKSVTPFFLFPLLIVESEKPTNNYSTT